MKKVFAVILCLALILVIFTGCECEHEYSAAVTLEPTYELPGIRTYTCGKCGDSYNEEIEKLVKETLSADVLNNALWDTKYSVSVFSISVGKLIDSLIGNYKIKYYTADAAIEHGYLTSSSVDSSVNPDNLYVAVVSGDVTLNPQVPFMTQFEEEAIVARLIFDDNENLEKYAVTLSTDMQTSAMILITSS